MPSDLEYAAMRLFGDWSDENTAKLAAGNAVMGAFTTTGRWDDLHRRVHRLGTRSGS